MIVTPLYHHHFLAHSDSRPIETSTSSASLMQCIFFLSPSLFGSFDTGQNGRSPPLLDERGGVQSPSLSFPCVVHVLLSLFVRVSSGLIVSLTCSCSLHCIVLTFTSQVRQERSESGEVGDLDYLVLRERVKQSRTMFSANQGTHGAGIGRQVQIELFLKVG